ncbi:hypothetical protein OROHE_017062 [Orobanche hederae]
MGESAGNVILEEILKAVIALAANEISIARAFQGELTKLTRSISIVQGFIEDAAEKQVATAENSHSVNAWIKSLTDIAYRARDTFEELDYEKLRRDIEIRGRILGMVRNFFSLKNPVVFHQRMARKIMDLNVSLADIQKDATDLGLQSRLVEMSTDNTQALRDRETQSSVDNSTIVGRDTEVSEIVRFLTITSTSTNQTHLRVYAVIGMPGLGKTTVAQQVFNNKLIKQYFDFKTWLCISHDFDVKTILINMLKDLGVRKTDEDSLELMAQSLEKKLQGKRYFLVLDDVWNGDRAKWESLRTNLLRGSNVGNGISILVTTRSGEVASVMGANDRVELRKLTDNECWSIFKEKAFENMMMTRDMEEIGTDLARKCHGVPLAAKVLGGLMQSKQQIEQWLSVQADEIWESPDAINGVLPALRISYDHLSPQQLKQCFAYCSTFVEDHVFEREKLVQCWMAEGFLVPPTGSSSMEMEEVGNVYFSTLLLNSLFQDVKRNMFGEIVDCKMHDLVHNLARRVYTPNATPKRRTMDATDSNWIDDKAPVTTKCLHYLGVHPIYTLEKLSAPMRELKHLRYVEITDSYFEESLPKVIVKLYYLQTLRLKDCHGFEKLWKDLRKLINLRHLCIDNCSNGLLENNMPIHMGRLSCLQTLPFFVVGSERGCGIDELGSLNKLGGELTIYHLEKVTNGDQARMARIGEKQKLKKLKLRWSGSTANDKQVLEGLEPHRNLKSLSVENYQGGEFPSWAVKMARLDRLVEIQLNKCCKCEKVPMLGHLPSLQFLEIIGLEKVKSIGGRGGSDDFYADMETKTAAAFPALRKFKLEDMSSLEKWHEFESDNDLEKLKQEKEFTIRAFPCLKELVVKNCPDLATFPSHVRIGHFTNLEKLEIDGIKSCPQIWTIIRKLNSLTSLYIWDVEQMPAGALPLAEIKENNKNLTFMRV